MDDRPASPPAARPIRRVAGLFRRTPDLGGVPRRPWPLTMLVISVVLALFFTILGFLEHARTLAEWSSLPDWAELFARNLVVSLVVAVVIQALFTLARLVLGRERIVALRGWRRTMFFAGIPILASVLGWPVGVTLAFGDLHVLQRVQAVDIAGLVAVGLVLTAAMTLFFSMRYRQLRAEMRAHDAQLRLLQGQMEPHFLFNTLANVISLIDADAPQAKRVLEAFTEYLRASLGSLRRADSTLGVELELAGRYLALMQARMGERLRVELDVPDALRGAALPPLLLQPLVENAIKHGLEPKVAGGTVRVRARTAHQGGVALLELFVEDDGIGLEAAARRRRPAARAAEGNGIALANLRERLHTQFGDLGAFEIASAGPQGGTLARLALPLSTGVAESPQAAPRRA